MSELLPTVQADEIHDGLLDYLTTTFALADPDAQLALTEFLSDREHGIFKGPFLRLRLMKRNPVELRQALCVRMVADNERNVALQFADFMPVQQVHQAMPIARYKDRHRRANR